MKWPTISSLQLCNKTTMKSLFNWSNHYINNNNAMLNFSNSNNTTDLQQVNLCLNKLYSLKLFNNETE